MKRVPSVCVRKARVVTGYLHICYSCVPTNVIFLRRFRYRLKMNCTKPALKGVEKIPLLNRDEYKLSYLQRVAYGFGHVFNDLCAAMWFSYLLFYLQIILQMKATIAGILLMIGQVFDALATPVAGWAVDKYGTKKSWHLMGTVMVVISFPLVYTKCFLCMEDNEIQQLFYHILVIVLFQIGWAIVQISHLSVIPNITDVLAQRSELTAIRYTASVCSSVVAYIVTWLVLRSQSQVDTVIGPSDYPKFREIVIVLLIMGAISTVIFHCGVDWNKCNKKSSNANSLLNIPKKNMFLSPILYQISSLYVASRLFMILNLVYMPLYLEEQAAINGDIGNINLREYLASVPLVSFVASFITSIVLKYKTDSWGNKNTYLFGSIISLSSCLSVGFYIPQTSNVFFIYIVAVLVGTGSSITIVSSLCLTAKMIGPNVDQGASVYSIVTFTDKLICGVAVVIIEHMKCADKSLCPEYYRYVLANVSGAAALFGIITLGTLKLSQRHHTSTLHI